MVRLENIYGCFNAAGERLDAWDPTSNRGPGSGSRLDWIVVKDRYIEGSGKEIYRLILERHKQCFCSKWNPWQKRWVCWEEKGHNLRVTLLVCHSSTCIFLFFFHASFFHLASYLVSAHCALYLLWALACPQCIFELEQHIRSAWRKQKNTSRIPVRGTKKLMTIESGMDNTL